jgi:neutral ceramidase
MLKAGFGVAEITPSFPVPLGGYENREGLSNGVHLPIYTRVAFFCFYEEKFVLISIELLGVDYSFTNQLREKVSFHHSIKKKNIFITTTHTHSAIEGFPAHLRKGLWQVNPIQDHELAEFVIKQTLFAVTDAFMSQEDALVFAGKGRGGVGCNRRNPIGLFDNELLRMDFIGVHNNKLGTIINYSCHPTILDSKNLLLSGDLTGWVMNKVEKQGGVCLFLNGAAGDISTRFQRKESSVTEVERLGNILLDDIENIRVKDMEVYAVNAREYEITYEEKTNMKRNTLIQTFRIGEFEFLFFPGEIFAEEGIRLKKLKTNLFIASCSNDYIGYVLADRTYEENGYEVEVTRLTKLEKQKLMNKVETFLREKY